MSDEHGGHGGDEPGQKAENFGATMRRFLGELRGDRGSIALAVVLAAASVALTVLGPKLLGDATNLVVAGAIGASLPAGVPMATILEGMRAQGQDRMADMMSGMAIVPGQGIDWPALGTVIGLAVAAYAASTVLMAIQGLVLTRVVQRLALCLRGDVQRKLDRIPLSYLDGSKRGDLLSRMTNDIDNIGQTLQNTLMQLVTSVLTILGILVMMFWVSWQLALIVLVTVPISGVIAGVVMKRAQPQFRAQWKATGEVSAQVEEVFTGQQLVAAYGREGAMTERFAGANEELYGAAYKAQFLSNTIMPILGFVANLIFVLVAVVGGLRVASGHLTIGAVQAFIQYSRQFNQPLAQLASMANMLQSGAASAERIFEVLDAPEEDPDADAQGPGVRRAAAPTGSVVATPELLSTAPVDARPGAVAPEEQGVGRVVFDHVSFRYDPARPLIEDLSLTVEPGSTVAIVGPTGAGKTTLVNLLLRFYEIDAGSISIDGVDIRDMTRAELRSRIGMVLQDTWLFEGSIEENIAFGDPRAELSDGAAPKARLGRKPVSPPPFELPADVRERVHDAAHATGVDRLAHALPQGYETVLDDEGGGVSVGERQLITIARAFISEPEILVLDEATSSVDTRTEMLVQQAMTRLQEGRTSFVIAHRLSTIRDADVILVMEHGDIVEQGNHDALVEADGAYARLYRSQFVAPALDEEPAEQPG